MKEILSNPSDKVELRLLFANQTEDDILLQDDLEALAAQHPDRCAARLHLQQVVNMPHGAERMRTSAPFL